MPCHEKRSSRTWRSAVGLLGWLMLVGCGPYGGGDGAGPEPEGATVENRGSGKDRWWEALPRPEWEAFDRLDDGAGWFEVYRVQPGVLAIYEPGQFEEVVSYLILGEKRALLFDTGLGIGDLRALVSSVTELPVAVLNSHSHYDHIGGNHQFDRVYGPDTPYTRARMKGLDHHQVAEASAHRLAALAPLVRLLLPGHNVGLVGSEYLIRMADAFDAVAAGEGAYQLTDGNREYPFENFSIIVAGI
jgi:hypothetical protein